MSKKLKKLFGDLKQKVKDTNFKAHLKQWGNTLKSVASKVTKEFRGRMGNSSQTDYLAMCKDVFNPVRRVQIHKWFQVTFFLLFFYLIGKIFALILGVKQKLVISPAVPLPAVSSEHGRIQKFIDNPIFKTKGREVAKQKKIVPVAKILKNCEDSKKKSSLPLKLENTIVLQNSFKSVASVKVNGKLINVREGEKLQSHGKVGKIDRLRLIFRNKNSGECEYIAVNINVGGKKINVLDPDQGKNLIGQNKIPGISNKGNHYNVSKELIGKKLENINEILTQARATQINNPDGSLAFRISEITPGSIYSFLGIKNENIIKSINGKKITGMNQIMNLFGKLKDLDQLQLTVEDESGNDSVLDYDFTQ